MKKVSEKGLVETFLSLRGMRFSDPFFEVSEGSSVAERSEWAKQRRAAARALHRDMGSRLGRLVVRVIGGSALLLSLGLFLPLGVRWMLDPADMKALRLLGFSVVQATLAWIFVLHQARRHRLVRAALDALGGEAGRDRFSKVLDWFDAHWPSDTPNDDVDLPGLFETRWDLATTYAGYPVLVLVHRRSATRHHAPVRRISVYLSSPAAVPGADEASRRAFTGLASLGYFAKRTPAGVFLCHPEIDLAMLERGRVLQALELARSIVEGTSIAR